MTGVAWHRVRVSTDSVQVGEIEALCWQHGAAAVSLLDAADQPLLEPGPGETPLWSEVVVEALLPADGGVEHLAMALLAAQRIDALSDLHIEAVAETAWERAWMDSFQAMRFGQRLWICPWHQPPEPSWSHVLRLDPGLAFGSGTHATTALCLEWLDGAALKEASVIDFGCGSGVLGLAAAVLGANTVVAVDHDPQALLATQDNAERNHLQATLTVCTPDAFAATDQRADCVLANILAEPLIGLAPALMARLKPGAWLVLSGILSEQAARVTAAYQTQLGPAQHAEQDGWVRLVFQAPAA